MYRLTEIDTGQTIYINESEVQTILNALSAITAECNHAAAKSDNDTVREAFFQSAQQYRGLRDKIEAFEQESNAPPRCPAWVHPGTEKEGWRCCLRSGHLGEHVREVQP